MAAGAEMGDASSFVTSSERETARLGRAIGELLGRGDVVFVQGRLGAGKTCLIRAICAGLGYDGRVRSPSFAVVNQYEGRCRIYHIDLYRISSDSPELEDLSRQEYFSDSVVTLIEWGGKLASWGVRPTLTIRMQIIKEDRRRIEIETARPGLARGLGEIRLD